MLVLSRKKGERIRIGKDVVITVVRIGDHTVKLGFDAPQGVNIVREELALRAESLDLSPEGSHGHAIAGVENGSDSGTRRGTD